MRVYRTKILSVVLLSVWLLSNPGLSWAQAPDDPPGSKEARPEKLPDLADIIPLATQLSSRLATLENKAEQGLDIPAVKDRYKRIEQNLDVLAGQLEQMADVKYDRYDKLVRLGEAVKRARKGFEEVRNPVRLEIRRLGAWRKEWLAEKSHWAKWQSFWLAEEASHQLQTTFDQADHAIARALELVIPQLEAMLGLQAQAGHIQLKFTALATALDSLMLKKRRTALLDESPPMISSKYLMQFQGRQLMNAVQKGLNEISWPDSRFLARQGWIMLIQGLISLFVTLTIYRRRQVLNESERWRFLAEQPVAAGLFLGYMSTVLMYEYHGYQETWKLANNAIGAFSFAWLSKGLIAAAWKRQFVYGLMIILILNRLRDVIGFPLPLSRLYTVLAALAGLVLCLKWARESIRQKQPILYKRALQSGSLFFGFIIIAELLGKEALAVYLLVSLTRSIATALIFILFMYMIHGGLEWLFRSYPFRRMAVLNSPDSHILIGRLSHFVDVAICGLVLLPGLLMIWGVYDTLEGALKGVLSLGFALGSHRINVGIVIVAACIFYGAILTSWVFEKLLMNETLVKHRVEMGVRHSISRLVRYCLISVGFLFAVSALGFDVTKLTIMLSALGVGIGFGLQGVVNNFVSGLLLLFERPVRVGDSIQIDGKWSIIKKIGLRATILQTIDQADLIIPNSDLINNQVTNWTLTNRQVRLALSVGVAYGSDVALVIETLAACAKDHKMVENYPPAQVLFHGFGDSTLDFQLRVWVKDVEYRLTASSELHQEIDRRFREAQIEIAFPQCDLHVRSVDESVFNNK